MLAFIYLPYIFSIVCGVNIYIYLGLYCCPHNSLSSTSLKYIYLYILHIYICEYHAKVIGYLQYMYECRFMKRS